MTTGPGYGHDTGYRGLGTRARATRVTLGLTDAVVGIGLAWIAPSVATVILGLVLLAGGVVLIATGLLGHTPVLSGQVPRHVPRSRS